MIDRSEIPTIDDLGREARIGTLALVPTAAVLVLAIEVVLLVGSPDPFVTGALVGGFGIVIYNKLDKRIERLLVDRDLVRERRGGRADP